MSDVGQPTVRRLPGRTAVLAWATLWVGVAALVVLPYVHSYRHLSPLDEMPHIDYVVKVRDGHLVRGGERMGQLALRAQACRGSDLDPYDGPPCAKRLRAQDFPFGGFNTAYPDPPAYYVITAAGATVVDALPGVDDFVTAARSVGVVWLGAGLALTFLLALQLGADRWSAAGATLIIASTPAVAHAASTTTSDAPGLLVGAGLCLVAVAFVRGRVPWWWLAPAAAAVTAVKATGVVVVGLVVVFLLLHLARPERAPRTEAGADDHDEPVADPPATLTRATVWLAVAAVAVPALAVLAAWTLVNRLTDLPAVDDPLLRGYFHVDSIGWTNLVSNLVAFLSPIQQGYLPPFLVNPTLGNLMALTNVVCIAGVAVLAWTGVGSAVRTRMAVATMVAMLLGGIGFVLLIFVGSHTYITIPPRYGLSILPAAAAALAVVASRRRVGGYALIGLGAACLVALLAQTL